MTRELKKDYNITYNIYNLIIIIIYFLFYPIQSIKNKNSRIKVLYPRKGCNSVMTQWVGGKTLRIT